MHQIKSVVLIPAPNLNRLLKHHYLQMVDFVSQILELLKPSDTFWLYPLLFERLIVPCWPVR